jgi:hypothetical protein
VQLEPIKAAVGATQQLSKYTGVGQALTLIFKEEGIQVKFALSHVLAPKS